MFSPSDITEIGALVKPHGIKGEIAATLDVDPDALRCLLVEMEGLLTPFFVESARRRGAEAWLLTIDGIDSEDAAKTLCGKKAYALREDVADGDDDDPDGLYASDLVGFTVADPDGNVIGTVDDIEDSTANVLFIVTRPDGSTAYIPVADEFIAAVDTDARRLVMDLPEGLLE